jgi:hypothetical protein
MATQLLRTSRTESNPYRPDLPESFSDVSPELYQFLREVIETLREQHNYTQAGDSTFSWELLTRIDLQKFHTLGSLGRFYHPQFGIIQARYVKYHGISNVTIGGPVGFLRETSAETWTVTNDLALSDSDAILGLMGAYTQPVDGSYGWVITHGANLQGVLIRTGLPIALFDRLTWNTSGELATGEAGRVIGSVTCVLNLTQIDTDVWEIPPGSLFVEAMADSELSTINLVNEVAEPIYLRLNVLESTLAQITGSAGIGGLTIRISEAEAAIITAHFVIAAESDQRMIAINSLSNRISDLELTGGGTGFVTTGAFLQLTDQLTDAESTLLDFTQATGVRLGDLDSRVSNLQSWRVETDLAIEGTAQGFGALSTRITNLNFVQLIDVPNSYLSQAGKSLRVNALETGLEFYSLFGVPAGGVAGNLLVKNSATNGDSSWVVAFAPSGRIAANTVQAAISELEQESISSIANSTDNAIVRWDGLTGQLIQNSLITVSDLGYLTHNVAASTAAEVISVVTAGSTTRFSVRADGRVDWNLSGPGGFLSWTGLSAIIGTNATATQLDLQVSGTLVAALTPGLVAVAGNLTVADQAFAVGWDGSTQVPTKNAVYDQVQVLITSIGTKLTGTTLLAASGTAPALNAPWTNLGGANALLRIRKSPDGIVHVQGTITATVGSPTAGVVLFTLPAGSRPQATQSFAVAMSGGTGRIEILANGSVVMQVGNTASTSLDGINFIGI